jgi:two-component sensor histidine kinase
LARLTATHDASILGAPPEKGASSHPAGAGTARQPENLNDRIEVGGLLIHLIELCRTQVAPGIVLGLNMRLGHGTMVDAQEAEALEFVFCEVVSNAYRYAHPAGTPVEVITECRMGRKGEIIIEIGDDGVGLSPDFAEWRDGGHGMAAVRGKLQEIDAVLNLTTDDLGLRFQIILHPSRRPNPARGNFVWL